MTFRLEFSSNLLLLTKRLWEGEKDGVMGYDKTHTNKIHDIHDILNINCNPSKVTSSYRDMSGGMMMYKKKKL